MTKLKHILILALLISQVNFSTCDDEDEDEPKDKTNDGDGGGDDAKEESEPKSEHKKPDIDYKKKLEEIKKDKNRNVLKGNTGKIYSIVIETIKEINPVRLLKEFDLETVIEANRIDINRFKFPVNYFSDAFWTKFAAKTKTNKKEISKVLGANIENRDEQQWASVATFLKFGSQKKITIGNYLECLGLDLSPYEKKYDEYMIESIRVPVQFLDEVLTEGFDKYINLIKNFVNSKGGPLNAALHAYGDYSGRDVVADTKKMIKRMKNFNVSNDFDFHNKKYEKAWNEYYSVLKKQWKMYYNYWFGKGGRFFYYQQKIADKMNKIMNVYTKYGNSLATGGKFKEMFDLAGTFLGAEGRAILYIIYQPTATYFNQIFGPMIVAPRILALDVDWWEKTLALPPILVQTSGGLAKPCLMVFEPIIRLSRFLVTGEYQKSLSSGLELSAAFGISIWGGAYKPLDLKALKTAKNGGVGGDDEEEEKPKPKPKPKPKKGEKKRSKREAEEKQVSPEEASKYTQSDKKLADAYQGGPPPGGYKLGIKNDGKLDLDNLDFISRVLLSPDFIMKAGGPVFVPFASVLAPTLRAINIVLFGDKDINQRIAKVPDIIRGVGLIGPLADIIQDLLPFIKTATLVKQGKLTSTDVLVQAPGLVKKASNGVLFGVLKNPAKLLNDMLKFLDGPGGVLAMLRLRSKYAATIAKDADGKHKVRDFGEEGNIVVQALEEFFGGWFLSYFQSIGPVTSLIGAWFNGILGNIISPIKFLNAGVELKEQPLKTILVELNDLPRLLQMADTNHTLISALTGGIDPHPLKDIGIDCEKLVANGIDPGLLLAAGKKLLPPEAKKKLESGGEAVGIDGKLLEKVGLNVNQFIDSGLLDADQEKLIDKSIDINAVIHRMMRGSIEDEILLANAGISIKTMLKAGICPASFLVGGISACSSDQIKALGVNKDRLSDDDLRKLGLNPAKLHSKRIDAKKLAKEGLESYAKIESTLGIKLNVLMASVYHGLDQKRMLKAGINLNTLLKAGIDARLLLIGGLREAMKGDISESSLSKVGIDAKQIDKMGININLLADVGLSVLSPLYLNRMAIDPMSVIIAGLSRRGLDTLTGGAEDPMSVSFGFMASILKITHNSYRVVPKIREKPFGRQIVSEDGRFTGIPGFFFYKFIGVDNYGGMLGFIKKLINRRFSKAEIMEIVNPIRIAYELAHPDKSPIVRRRKDNRKSVDDYHSAKSRIFGKHGGDEGSEEEEAEQEE